MTERDLQMLVDFRSEVPAPSTETAERIYARAISRRSRIARPRTHRRPSLAVLFAAAALVLVPTALAFRGQVIDLFQRTPPAAISTAATTMERTANGAMKAGFAARYPIADVSKLHGVMEIQTADGPEDLWVAPNDLGGQCSFVNFANDPVSATVVQGTCDTATTPPASNITFNEFRELPHPTLLTAFGRVYVDAASVKLTRADGSAVTAPVLEGYYLASLDKADQVISVTAYDAAGSAVAEWGRP